MIGLGILEIAFITGAGYYIISHFTKKKKIQYIEINQEQFDQIQDSLIVHNIVPVNMNSNNFYDRLQQIPPTYQESENILPPVPPYQSTGPSQIYLNSNTPAILETTDMNSQPLNITTDREENLNINESNNQSVSIEQNNNSIMTHSI